MQSSSDPENSEETKDSATQTEEAGTQLKPKKVPLRKRRLSDPIVRYICAPKLTADPLIQTVKSRLMEVDLMYNYKAYEVPSTFLNMHPRLNNVGYCNFIDWLAELSTMRGFRRDLAWRTTNIFNMYLHGIFDLDPRQLERVGLCCFFIAAKVDDTDSVTADDLVEFSSNKAVTVRDYVNLEATILEVIQYRLLYRSPLEYFFQLADIFGYSKSEVDAGWFILESVLIMPDSAEVSPYLLALIVSRLINVKIKNVAFDDRLFTLCNCTKLRANQLTSAIMKNVISLQIDPKWSPIVHRIKKKFASPEFSQVSKFPLF